MNDGDAGQIRVLIVEDDKIVREGLVALLTNRSDLSVIAHTGDDATALHLVEDQAPHVVLLDLVLHNSRIDGAELVGEIVRLSPTSRVLVLSAHTEDDLVFPALMSGAVGYMLKQSGVDEIVEAIHDVARGEYHLDPLIIKKIIERMRTEADRPILEQAESEANLTKREKEILPLLVLGLTNLQIAERLNIARYTVKTHVSNILRKLGVKQRSKVLLGLATRASSDDEL